MLIKNLILGVTPAHMEGQLATEDMRSQVPYEICSANCVVEILDKVFNLAYIPYFLKYLPPLNSFCIKSSVYQVDIEI